MLSLLLSAQQSGSSISGSAVVVEASDCRGLQNSFAEE
jgi:hypothetical protein